MRRLGLILDQILFSHGDTWSTDEVFIQFVQAVAERGFDRIDFCSRVSPAEHSRPYRLGTPPFRIVPLPWYPDIPSLGLRAPWVLPRAASVLREMIPQWSLAMAVGIHPLSVIALRQARRHRLPAVLWLRGDLSRDLAHRLHGVRGAAAQLAYRGLVAALPRGVPVISMGRDDYPFLTRLGPVHVAYSSKFGREDLVPLPRPARPPTAPLRLLYVGRLAPEKGVEVLLHAVEILQWRLEPSPLLTVIGYDYHGSQYGERFRRLVGASLSGPLVTLAGHVPFGPDLLACYDRHDVLVLPSFTEGFPQVVLEAMARGVPVVATAVGGVPRLIRHGVNGLLVAPGRPGELAEVISRLASSPSLAAGLAREGRAAVLPYTREEQVAGVGAFLEQVAGGTPRSVTSG